jgi:hypothetical protein
MHLYCHLVIVKDKDERHFVSEMSGLLRKDTTDGTHRLRYRLCELTKGLGNEIGSAAWTPGVLTAICPQIGIRWRGSIRQFYGLVPRWWQEEGR